MSHVVLAAKSHLLVQLEEGQIVAMPRDAIDPAASYIQLMYIQEPGRTDINPDHTYLATGRRTAAEKGKIKNTSKMIVTRAKGKKHLKNSKSLTFS